MWMRQLGEFRGHLGELGKRLGELELRLVGLKGIWESGVSVSVR